MRVGGGKSKGSQFERKVCQQLSLWITHGQHKDCLWRSAMSGGRSTVGLKRGEKLARQAGDITSISPEGHALTDPFFIECKHYAQLNLRSFFLTGLGTLASHWKQTRLQAMGYNKTPMLIARQNNVPTVLVCLKGMAHLLVGKDPEAELIRVVPVKIDQLWCEVSLFEDVLSLPFKYRAHKLMESTNGSKKTTKRVRITQE